MKGVTAIASFCSDVREEMGGSRTVVGIFPDNVLLQKVPARLGKLCVYLRANVDVANKSTSSMFMYLRTPDGEEQMLQEFAGDHIVQTQKQAVKNGFPYAGLVSQLTFPEFVVPQHGRIDLVLKRNGEQLIVGSLNFTDKRIENSIAPVETEGQVQLKIPGGHTQFIKGSEGIMPLQSRPQRRRRNRHATRAASSSQLEARAGKLKRKERRSSRSVYIVIGSGRIGQLASAYACPPADNVML